MPRPKKDRRIKTALSSFYFKPQGIPARYLEKTILGADEVEALRLADMLMHTQEEAAVKMNISRATFGRIIEKARQKVADSLINGKAIRITGTLPEKFADVMSECRRCGNIRKINKEECCPKCRGEGISK